MLVDGGTNGGTGIDGTVRIGSQTGHVVLSKAGLTTTVSGVLRVSQSASVAGTLQLGSTSKYTIGRTPQTATAGQSTSILGQTGGPASVGGDLILDAGLGVPNGLVRVGLRLRAFRSVVRQEHCVLGQLIAPTLTVTGLANPGSLSTLGSVTAAGATVTGSLSAAAGLTTPGTITAAVRRRLAVCPAQA